MAGITNHALAFATYELAKTRRIDFILGGHDSNSLYGNVGYTNGFSEIFARLYGLYSTGATSPNQYGRSSGAAGYQQSVIAAATLMGKPQTTPATNASATSGSPVITDAAATFTSTLAVGQWVTVNTTTQTIGRVLSIDSDTQITLTDNAAASGTGRTITAYAVPPADALAFYNPGALADGLWPHIPAYIAASETDTNTNTGLAVAAGSPIDRTQNAICSAAFVRFPTGSGGSWKPYSKMQASPYTQSNAAATSGESGTAGYDYSVVDWSNTGAASNEQVAMNIYGAGTSANTITGPLVWLYSKAIDASRSYGFGVHIFNARSGDTATQRRNALYNASDSTIDTFLDYATRHQSQTMANRIAIIELCLGTNGSEDAATFATKISDMMTRYRERWAAIGGTAANLHFQLRVGHPQGDATADARLAGYRTQMETLATNDGYSWAIDTSAFLSSAEMVANGVYVAAGATSGHLHFNTTVGYQFVCSRIMREIQSYAPTAQYVTDQAAVAARAAYHLASDPSPPLGQAGTLPASDVLARSGGTMLKRIGISQVG